MFGFEWVQIAWFVGALLVAVGGGAAFVYGRKLLKVRIGPEKFNMVKSYALELVKWAEQQGGIREWSNEQKRILVGEAILEFCEDNKIPMTIHMIDFIIEAAVYTVKQLKEVLEP